MSVEGQEQILLLGPMHQRTQSRQEEATLHHASLLHPAWFLPLHRFWIPAPEPSPIQAGLLLLSHDLPLQLLCIPLLCDRARYHPSPELADCSQQRSDPLEVPNEH